MRRRRARLGDRGVSLSSYILVLASGVMVASAAMLPLGRTMVQALLQVPDHGEVIALNDAPRSTERTSRTPETWRADPPSRNTPRRVFDSLETAPTSDSASKGPRAARWLRAFFDGALRASAEEIAAILRDPTTTLSEFALGMTTIATTGLYAIANAGAQAALQSLATCRASPEQFASCAGGLVGTIAPLALVTSVGSVATRGAMHHKTRLGVGAEPAAVTMAATAFAMTSQRLAAWLADPPAAQASTTQWKRRVVLLDAQVRGAHDPDQARQAYRDAHPNDREALPPCSCLRNCVSTGFRRISERPPATDFKSSSTREDLTTIG